MKSSLVFLCITLVVFTSFSARSDTDEGSLNDLDDFLPAREPRFPIDLGLFIGRYEFDWIEDIDGYYGTYFKYWEDYLTNEQKKFAGKFGLSNIYFKPDFRNYENTKVVLCKSIQNDWLLLRYLAPVGDMGDFGFSIALKPFRRMTLLAEGYASGERSIAAVFEGSFGCKTEASYTDKDKRARKILERMERLLK